MLFPLQALAAATSLERLLRWVVHRAEHTIRVKYPKCSEAAGTPINQSVVIIDLEGASLSAFTETVRGYLKQYFQLLGENFPGNLARVFIINVPFFFQPIWSMVRMAADSQPTCRLLPHPRPACCPP